MKIAVIGLGGMGGTVVEHLKEIDIVTAITGYDISAENAAEKKAKYQIEIAANLEQILADSEVKAAFVTASNDAHKPVVMKLIEAGIPIMCEKPMATTLSDAEEMVEAAKRKNLFFQIGFELRYSKLYTTIKDWIDAGLLGDIINTECNYICSEFHGKGSWRNKKATGGGMFGEKLSHYVDLPRWWVGSPVTEVHSVCAPNLVPYYEVHDNYYTTYRFENGAVSHMTFMMAVGAKFDGDPLLNVINQQIGDGHCLRFMVVGTKGAADTDVFGRHIKRWEFTNPPEGFTSKWVENLTWSVDEDDRYFHSTFDQTKDIIRRIAEGLEPMTPASDALETMKLVFAAEESADSGKIVRLR